MQIADSQDTPTLPTFLRSVYRGRMVPSFFTLLCEFQGGTFVSQVHAHDERHALREWAEVLKREKGIGAASYRIAIRATEQDEPPVPLDGMIGVWCWTAIVDEHLAIANIVRST